MGELSAMQAFGNELIPRERFTSAEFVALEYERLWPRVWQVACRLEEIPNPGDFVEYTIGDHSAFVTRTASGDVRAFHNTCIHRGTRLASGCGSFRGEIRCPFHGWRWDLDGTNTYVVGSSPAWVIDPGPADRDHIDLVRRVGETRGGIAGVLLTHSHSDHNGGCGMLGVEVVVGNEDGFDDLAAMLAAEPVAMPPAPAARQVGPFTVLPTPGHAPDHVAYSFGEVCFCGDLVLGEGSTIVPPAAGGGSLADYMRSLDVLAAIGASLLCPGHGEWITDPAAKIAEYAATAASASTFSSRPSPPASARRASSSTRRGRTSRRRCAPPRRSRCGPISRSSTPKVGSPAASRFRHRARIARCRVAAIRSS